MNVRTTLYTRDILRLAASLPVEAGFDAPDGEGTARSPTCGSQISALVDLDSSGRVAALHFDVSACAMGQASAAVLLRHAVGLSRDDIEARHARMQAVLSGETPSEDDWPELVHLATAADYPGRHGAMLIPYRALEAAMSAATDATGD